MLTALLHAGPTKGSWGTGTQALMPATSRRVLHTPVHATCLPTSGKPVSCKLTANHTRNTDSDMCQTDKGKGYWLLPKFNENDRQIRSEIRSFSAHLCHACNKLQQGFAITTIYVFKSMHSYIWLKIICEYFLIYCDHLPHKKPYSDLKCTIE